MRGRHVALAALIGVQAILHVAAAAVTGFVVAFALVGQARPGDRWAELARVVGVGLPALAVAAVVLLFGAGEHSVAPQDVATDGLAVMILPPSERGTGNGVMTAAKFTGSLSGGAGLSWLIADHDWPRFCLIADLD